MNQYETGLQSVAIWKSTTDDMLPEPWSVMKMAISTRNASVFCQLHLKIDVLFTRWDIAFEIKGWKLYFQIVFLYYFVNGQHWLLKIYQKI